MSASRPYERGAPRPADVARLRARRRAARRRTRLARIDLALGVLGGLVLLLASPGPAMTAVIVLVVLALCAGSGPLARLARRERRRGPRGLRDVRARSHRRPSPHA